MFVAVRAANSTRNDGARGFVSSGRRGGGELARGRALPPGRAASAPAMSAANASVTNPAKTYRITCSYVAQAGAVTGQSLAHETLEVSDELLRLPEQVALRKRTGRDAHVDALDERRVLPADLVVELE